MANDLISYGKCLGEGSIYYSSQSIVCTLSTSISRRYRSPETNWPQNPQYEHFLLYQGPICRTCKPSAILYISWRADPRPSAIILCSHRPESKQPNHLLYSRTEGYSRMPGWGISPTSPLLVYRCCVLSWKHLLFCLLAFDVCWLSSSRMQYMQPVYSKILSSV